MSEVVDKLIEKHETFADREGLQLLSKEHSPEFGGSVCLKYQNDRISLMITKSRDGICYDLGPGVRNNQKWYSVDIVWNLLVGNDRYRKMKNGNPFSYIQESVGVLGDLFSEEKRELTLSKLHQLEVSRSKVLFGC